MTRSCLTLMLSFVLCGHALAASPCEEWMALGLPTSGDESGIGGTGRSESGIGGTGRTGDEKGIGGTGMYGSITGFGSICVNGIRVHLNDGTQVRRNGNVIRSEDLELGHVVWIEGRVNGTALHAESVQAHSSVIGTIDMVNVESQALSVGGMTVRVTESTILVDRGSHPISSIESFVLGDRIDVSGLQYNDAIVATRIHLTDAADTAEAAMPVLSELVDAFNPRWLSIEAHVDAALAETHVQIAGFDVDISAFRSNEIQEGARVWLIAEPKAPGRIRAEQLSIQSPGIEPPRLPQPEVDPPAPPAPPVPVYPKSLGASDRPELFQPEADEPALPDRPKQEPPTPPRVDRPIDAIDMAPHIPEPTPTDPPPLIEPGPIDGPIDKPNIRIHDTPRGVR